ncbi:MAG TPA: hypothetical protein DIW37_00445 [Chryseobacterium sp.]|nr:hypothetical protein [Chryseobacterium sp.]
MQILLRKVLRIPLFHHILHLRKTVQLQLKL